MSNNEDNMEIDATATLEEKCSSWVELCVNTQDPKTVQETLKAEAREFFRSALAVPSNYKDPREAALARLIQSIGRALTASFPSRICALSVLCGATEGIRAAESKLSMRTANLVIAFLMEQCGPIQNDDETGGVNYYSVEDYDEQIRDIAVENLAALLRCRFEIMSKGDVVTRASETVRFRCNAARQGIERRCAAPEEEDSHMDHGLGVSALNDVRGGLSTLPRSRRSRCFSLIQAVVEGIEDLVQNNKKSVAKIGKSEENELVDFVRFACNCLQGESDPRCLVQLLLLLNKIQVTFQPLFLEAQLATFPITEVFDAIAPYYPINFTPPPNDNYGITQKGLRDALMAVLSHFGYDELAAKKKKDTMLNLSLGIVLERLIPMGGDGDHLAETAREKQEAVDDLNPILFPADDSSFDRLDKGSVQQLSSALMVVHQQASVAVSQGGGNSDDDKYLADSCRTLISKIAFRLEGTNHKELWEAFVKDPVESISTQLLSTSTDGRIAIAFIACFAASGGAQTLQWALHVGLPPLIGILKNGLQDEGLATTAAYGVGAFFSSCNVAMDKAAKNGVVLHPHPLEQFSSGAFQNLYDLFENSADGHSVSLRTASIRALESILLVSPSNQIAGSEREKVTTFARSLADHVLEASEPGKASSGDVDFIETCSQALGTIIGKCMSTLSGDNVSTDELSVLTSEQVKNHLKGEVLVDILFKAKQETRGKDHLRYDRKVLAKACSSNLSAATFVIEALLHAIKDALQQYSVGSESLACAQALSHALEEGGVVAARAFHELAPPNVTAHDIFDKLSEIDPRKGKGKTNLDLPATGEETESAKRQTQELVSMLLPAYQKWVPSTEVYNLVSTISKILPPLSDKDVAKLSITLPLLSASLEACELNRSDSRYEAMVEQITSVVAELASYALNLDYDARSRSAAAACLHTYIVYLAPREIEVCPVQRILENVIMPSLVAALESTSNKSQAQRSCSSTVAGFVDCLNLASVVGSAAACRGGTSSSTADKVALFLVHLACARKAAVPYAQDSNFEVDLLAYDGGDSGTSFSFAMSAAAAFGSMLCIHDGRPIWKQRITHNTVKYLEPILKANEETGVKPTTETLGLVAIVCHIICAGNFKNISLPTRGVAVRAAVRNLVSGPLYDNENLKNPIVASNLVSVKKLMIASILKLSSSSPGLLSSYIESIITGLMRAYAVTADSDPLTDVTCKLLILQVFERLCHLEIGHKTLLAVRPAVVSILGAAMNHPSRMLREAAVAVRNIWFTLE